MPRTDTSDPSPFTPGPLISIAVDVGIITNQVFLNNDFAGINVVVTSMDICNASSGSSVSCAIGIGGTNVAGAVPVFGGETGAGQFDTFSWRGQLVLRPGDTLICFAASGAWGFNASGYRSPAIS